MKDITLMLIENKDDFMEVFNKFMLNKTFYSDAIFDFRGKEIMNLSSYYFPEDGMYYYEIGRHKMDSIENLIKWIENYYSLD